MRLSHPKLDLCSAHKKTRAPRSAGPISFQTVNLDGSTAEVGLCAELVIIELYPISDFREVA
jgi:hypothetical protein